MGLKFVNKDKIKDCEGLEHHISVHTYLSLCKAIYFMGANIPLFIHLLVVLPIQA